MVIVLMVLMRMGGWHNHTSGIRIGFIRTQTPDTKLSNHWGSHTKSEIRINRGVPLA